MLDIETIILQYLLFNRDYFEKVINYLDYKLFETSHHKCIAKIIHRYFIEESICIPFDILGVKIQNLEGVNTELISNVKQLYNRLVKPENNDIDSVIKETEAYFKQRKIWLAISDGIEEYDRKKQFTSEFLSKAEDAIAYSFDNSVGYDYKSNIKERFALYREDVVKIPTSIDILNEYTNGGIQNKTLNACISATNGGKSVWLCQEAAFHLKNGKNVLYITLEMSEIEISKRIDANLLNKAQDDLKNMSADAANLYIKTAMQKNLGELIIKELPGDSTTTLDIKNVIDMIKRQRKIDIDILIVDYLGIMGSYRYSTRNNNSYSIGKHTAEELRSLAVQYNIPIWTAIQFNRGAENPEDYKSIGMEKTSDSYGIPMTLDFLFAILHTNDLDVKEKTIFKILKTRYGNRKNNSGLFTVKHNYPMGRFENDPDQLNFDEKDESNTKLGKSVKKAIEAEEKMQDKLQNKVRVMDGTNENLFDNQDIGV